jgi:Acetyltransferase (GNAT) domain
MELWEGLERAIGCPGLACSHPWVETWLEHYGDLVPHRFALGEHRGTPIGLALVTDGIGQRRSRVPVRTVHLGTAGEPPADSVFVQRNRLLVTAEHGEAFASALIAALWEESKWDEVVLDGFVPEDAELLLRAGSFDVRHETCRTVDLSAADETGGEVIALFGAKTRKNFRRSLKGLAIVETEWAETPRQARDILDELIILHQASWAGRGHRGLFASTRLSGFHRDLTSRLASAGQLSLFRIRDERSTIACLYGFIEGNRLLSYQSGISRPDHRLSPGLVADVLCMQAARDRGLATYDHLSGDSPYKQRLSTDQEPLIWAGARRGRARWTVVNAARLLGGARRGLRAFGAR